MNESEFPYALTMTGELVQGLFTAAMKSAQHFAAATGRPDYRPTRGVTLRPGADTPLWNEIVRRALPHLKRRGEKARLARILGVPRQRLNDYLKTGRACPDAERALLLLCWVASREQGQELTA
jgi:hypothetical protein